MSQPTQDNSVNGSFTLNHLNTLLAGVIIAQKRGVYSFEESGALAEPVKIISQFIKLNSEEKQNLEQQTKQQSQSNNVQIPSTIQEDDLTLKNLI